MCQVIPVNRTEQLAVSTYYCVHAGLPPAFLAVDLPSGLMALSAVPYVSVTLVVSQYSQRNQELSPKNSFEGWRNDGREEVGVIKRSPQSRACNADPSFRSGRFVGRQGKRAKKTHGLIYG
eukprot:scaffold255_cov22-Cyclotella_meneghiniana.AAC.1